MRITFNMLVPAVVFGMLAIISEGSKPVVEVEVRPATGVAQEVLSDLEEFGSILRSALGAGGVVDVVDRSEFGDLVRAREFSMASSPEAEALQSGMDAASRYRVVARVGAFAKTGVIRGPLRSEYHGVAAARVVDVQRGTSVADVQSRVKGFYATGTDAATALADDLATKINEELAKLFPPPSVSPSGAQGGGHRSPGSDMVVLRVRDAGNILVSNDQQALSPGDKLKVYIQEEFEDPRNPGTMLMDEEEIGDIEVIRVTPNGAVARALTQNVDFEPLMVVRKMGGTTVAEVKEEATPPREKPAAAAIPATGTKPSLFIGSFKYSNEFDLSQTASRAGTPITTPGAGQGSLATAGALIGGLATGGKPAEWLGGALAGAVAGQVADSERRQYEHGGSQRNAQMPSDEKQTAIDKESQVLREMVRAKAHRSQRFTVVENDRIEEIRAQMNLETDGDYDTSSLVRRGRLQGAKYSAFGTITRFETNRRQRGFSVVGGQESVEMKITMFLRMVDNETGTTVVGDEVTSSIFTESSQAGFLGFGTASENQGAIGELMDNLAQNVIGKIVTTLWPIRVMQVNPAQRRVMISAGEAVVSQGDRLVVYQICDPVVDPYTGETVGHSETEIGTIEVIETQARFSVARIVKPVNNVEQVEVGFMCRPVIAPLASTSRPATRGRGASGAERAPRFQF